jgi:hypothetical protein
MTETEVISIDRHGQRKECSPLPDFHRLRYRPPLRGTVVD